MNQYPSSSFRDYGADALKGYDANLYATFSAASKILAKKGTAGTLSQAIVRLEKFHTEHDGPSDSSWHSERDDSEEQDFTVKSVYAANGKDVSGFLRSIVGLLKDLLKVMVHKDPDTWDEQEEKVGCYTRKITYGCYALAVWPKYEGLDVVASQNSLQAIRMILQAPQDEQIDLARRILDSISRTFECIELVSIFLAANDNETVKLMLRKAASFYGLTENVRNKIVMVMQAKGWTVMGEACKSILRESRTLCARSKCSPEWHKAGRNELRLRFYHPNKAVPQLAERLQVLETLTPMIPSGELEHLWLEEARLIVEKMEELDSPWWFPRENSIINRKTINQEKGVAFWKAILQCIPFVQVSEETKTDQQNPFQHDKLLTRFYGAVGRWQNMRALQDLLKAVDEPSTRNRGILKACAKSSRIQFHGWRRSTLGSRLQNWKKLYVGPLRVCKLEFQIYNILSTH